MTTGKSVQSEDIIIAPHELCQSCHSASGPAFSLSAHRDTMANLRTNPTLTTVEIALVEANIENAETEGVLLDREILRIQRILQKLQQRRSEVRRFEELERGLLSPIRKLPMEILRYIFVLAHTAEEFYCNDFKVFPRVAAQVSSYWRSVSHSCGTLWANVKCMPFVLPEGMPLKNEYSPRYAKLLEDCIHYSNGTPMSICLGSKLTPEVLGDSCVKAMAECAYRWRNIEIVDEELANAVFALLTKDSQMEYLEKLDLYNINNVFSFGSAPKLTHLRVFGLDIADRSGRGFTVGSAPSLVHLSIGRIHMPSAAISGFHWSQITQYESINIEYQPREFIAVLERMPNLTSLTIYGPTGAMGRITLPHLTTLRVSGSNGPQVFYILTTPRLTKLDVGWDFGGSSVAEFVRRCGCILEELKVSGSGIDTSWMAPEFESIKTFCLNGPLPVGESIELLTRSDFLPKLERLHIFEIDGPDEEDQWTVAQLVHMLNSRIRTKDGVLGPAKRSYLKSLDLRFEIIFSDEEARILTDFYESELVINSEIELNIEDGSHFHLIAYAE